MGTVTVYVYYNMHNGLQPIFCRLTHVPLLDLLTKFFWKIKCSVIFNQEFCP